MIPSDFHPPIAQRLCDVTTDRLDLQRLRDSDLEELTEVFAHPEVWRFPYGRALDRDETQAFLDAQVAAWDGCGFGLWAVRQRSNHRLVGFVGLSVPTFLPEILPAVEVGWRLAPAVWGRGYATEAGAAALHEAFTTLGLGEVCAIPQTDNPASIRVAERLGMRLARAVRIPASDRRGPLDGLLYSIDLDSWLRHSTG